MSLNRNFLTEKCMEILSDSSGSTAQMPNWIRNKAVRPIDIRAYAAGGV